MLTEYVSTESMHVSFSKQKDPAGRSTVSPRAWLHYLPPLRQMAKMKEKKSHTHTRTLIPAILRLCLAAGYSRNIGEAHEITYVRMYVYIYIYVYSRLLHWSLRLISSPTEVNAVHLEPWCGFWQPQQIRTLHRTLNWKLKSSPLVLKVLKGASHQGVIVVLKSFKWLRVDTLKHVIFIGLELHWASPGKSRNSPCFIFLCCFLYGVEAHNC